ncbi:hypothetical protein [Isoalcanivorax beigongshangi]|uniref:Chromosome partitioning protein ParA n=1 Tax=Isoalcanivorax beigongshangi TaxID=3238810 RepID=A0ABV4AFY5_9GAMM
MLHSDFEAILDGMVGVPEYAGQELRCVYAVVNGQLQALALVLFLLEFDDDGMADHQWNLPLRHLAEQARSGPDMGAGPIRLVCRSQCPVSWHRDQLWDPSMVPGRNDFIFIRDNLRERGEKMGLHLAATPPPNEVNPDERLALAQQLKTLRLQVRTLTASQQEELAKARLAGQQREAILSAQLEKLLHQFKALKAQNQALKDQNQSLREQADALSRALAEASAASQSRDHALESLQEQYRRTLAQQLEQARAEYQEQLHTLELSLIEREQQLDSAHQQAQSAKEAMAGSGASVQQTLERLQQQGLRFIAFHAGVGHVAVAAGDLASYMDNPLRYAAEKCLVSESHYRAWLDHYQQPVCQALGANNAPCGQRIPRIDHPQQFRPQDPQQVQCANCQPPLMDSALRFR